jgi:hypothetical protein
MYRLLSIVFLTCLTSFAPMMAQTPPPRRQHVRRRRRAIRTLPAMSGEGIARRVNAPADADGNLSRPDP